MFTGIETAELTKYAANAFLAMKVTFINEMADLCEKVRADVHDVARGIGLDGRIGRKFLHPGPGYGGSCFPKDTTALAFQFSHPGDPRALEFRFIDGIALFAIAASVALYLYLRNPRRDPAFVLNLGLAYLVVTAIDLGVMIHWGKPRSCRSIQSR